MSSIKCSSCGHRILLPTDLVTCTNCGALLPMQSMTPEQSVIPYAHPRSLAHVSRHLPATFGNTSLQPHLDQSVSPYQPTMSDTSVEPYMDVTPTMPEDDIIISRGHTKISSSSLWTRGMLPWWFPARPPDIEGTIIQIHSQEEHPLHIDFIGSLFRLLGDILWAVPHTHNGHEQGQNRVFVTSLRIRTPGRQLRRRVLREV